MVEFAYAVGRIRALEAHLLDESRVIRMMDARDFETAYQVLRENPYYAEKIDRLENAFDFESLLKEELSSVIELLNHLAPKNAFLSALFEKYRPGTTLSTYLKKLNQTGKKHPLPFFVSYVKAFTSLYQLKQDIKSGKIDPETAENKFRYTDYHRVVSPGLEHYKKTGSLYGLERETDNYLLGIVKMAKYRAFGIEPLFGFAIAKENEIKILRLVLTAKRMKLNVEAIKERIRLTYV